MSFSFNSDRADVIETFATSGQLTVGTTPVEIKVGATRQGTRQLVRLYNASNNSIYWSFNPSFTVASGEEIPKSSDITWQVGDLPIYAIAASAGNVVIVHEAG